MDAKEAAYPFSPFGYFGPTKGEFREASRFLFNNQQNKVLFPDDAVADAEGAIDSANGPQHLLDFVEAGRQSTYGGFAALAHRKSSFSNP